MSEPNVTLPEGIERAIGLVSYSGAQAWSLDTLRREIAAAMMEAQADVWPMGASDLRARARAIREGK